MTWTPQENMNRSLPTCAAKPESSQTGQDGPQSPGILSVTNHSKAPPASSQAEGSTWNVQKTNG